MISDRELVKYLGNVGSAFFQSFSELRQSQRESILPILAGENVLLACPTASGKTEAVFAPLIAAILAKGSSVDRVRLIAVAPTRALVNDLYHRLESLLRPLGLSCARQTSDHHSGPRLAFVIITTPESLDSLLARRSKFADDGTYSSHDLDSVEAVFIDEAHLFDSSARGDQLCWLLARLRRLKRVNASEKNVRSTIQVCAASATVSTPMDLARRLLGKDCKVVSVAGARELLLFDDDDKSWHKLSTSDSSTSLVSRILLVGEASSKVPIAEGIWRAMSSDQTRNIRKILVFVPSRGLCDELGTVLTQYLQPMRRVSVYSHHGSLEKSVRETAEQGFSQNRDAILVATSTLEVGVDIGDVDAVVLIGPPPNTNGLLQRVGRAGRREGITRVIAIARNQVERLAIASMLVAARDGLCDPTTYGRRWSVCIQQISSFIRQAPSGGRRISDVKDLANDVWGGNSGEMAEAIIHHLVDQGQLSKVRGDRVSFGEDWERLWEGMGMHGNIDGGSVVIPVIDATTGEVLAQLPLGSKVPNYISFGGSNYSATLKSGELLITGSKVKNKSTAIKYSSTRSPMTRHFGRHVQLGLACSEYDFFRYDFDGRTFTFHFGGLIYERCLHQLFPSTIIIPHLSGIALEGDLTADIGQVSLANKNCRDIIMRTSQNSERMLALGPFHKQLPDHVRQEVLESLLPIDDFFNWISSRNILTAHTVDAIRPMLNLLISEKILANPPLGSKELSPSC